MFKSSPRRPGDVASWPWREAPAAGQSAALAGTRRARAAHRALDLVLAGVGLIFCSPVALVIALAVKLGDGGPIFYRAARVGRHGRLFRLYKFRTMHVAAGLQGSAVTAHGDPRVTRVGRWLRRSKLDELPQLLNVLRGEMSLVGPRPEDLHYVALYSAEQRRVLDVRPGITSAASLAFRHEEQLLTGPDWESRYRNEVLPAKLVLDLDYQAQRTIGTDLLLLARTAAALTGMGGQPRAGGGLLVRRLLGLRNRHFLAFDILAFLLTPALALGLRLDGNLDFALYGPTLIIVTLVFLLIKIVILYQAGLYTRFWAYASIDELGQIIFASLLVAAVETTGFLFVLRPWGALAPGFPRSLLLIDSLLVLLAVGGLRYSVRLAARLDMRRDGRDRGERVLVVGAGEAGVMIVEEMQNNRRLGLHPVGFVDDDPRKLHARIRGVQVRGARARIPDLVRETGARQVIIAMPRASGKTIREIVAICDQAAVQTKTIPGIYEILDGSVSVNQLRNVDIGDLLRREAVQTDIAAVRELVQGKRVLVTGGGGSIGSELCRQLLRCRPAALVILGHGENSIFEIANELRFAELRPRAGEAGAPDAGVVRPVIADIRFAGRIEAIFADVRPEIVFHAAAHKHVPLMEINAHEAITNNVLGTRNVLRAARAVGVERFVMLSTDKAVNPTSVMGASKRAAELLVHQAALESGRPYVAVRFGNVLGSRGSVLQTFRQQIAAGGPLTITHPEMTRFFMTIPEAVQLVLQAAVLGQGGEIFVLDMGEPVKILDLARDLIALSGLEVGRDIDITFTGPRPGEKLFEELFVAGEDYVRTQHEKIFIAGNASRPVPAGMDARMAALVAAVERDCSVATLAALWDLIPECRSAGAAHGGAGRRAEVYGLPARL